LLRGFKAHEKSCPYEDLTRRNDMKNLLESIDKLNKDARKNLFRAMNKIHADYLPKKKSV